MQHKKHKKIWSRLTLAAIAAVMVMSLMPLTASARETGHTVLTEDYYSLSDSNAPQVPGLTYYCACADHGKKMVEYYVEEENSLWREVPGVVERVGNKLRYVKGYYCLNCYEQFASGHAKAGDSNANKSKEQLGIEGTSLADYFQYISEHDSAFLSGCGFYYGVKDDFEHIPYPSGSQNSGKTYAPTFEESATMMPDGTSLFTKALPEPLAKQPDTDDPVGNWDVTGAWTFYQFYYTGMRQVINKPASADDPAWDTVKDLTRIYYMQRQMDNQTYACRVDNVISLYSCDYSKLTDWRITDIMVEYATGEVCGYATYVGTDSEVAVPEKINIPVYGDVKVVGLDVENHGLTKVYVNDNVTCIRRLSSVNLEEISGCKNLEYIEKYAFQSDVSLKTLPEMPKLDWIAMGAFEGCISLRDIKLPDNMTFIDFTAFGWYDTALGNYDIGMDTESWEAFQYLRDLSDNDRISGLTLYAKKGSTTYNLLDTLINKNDALTPELDSSGKPSFKSYGESVYLMSGNEVEYFTSHWNLKSSGDYKGSLASTDKDVDDSTGGRLGEYNGSLTFEDIIKNPIGWLKQLLGMGGTAFLLLLFLLSFLGFSGGKYDPESIKFKMCWGLITIDYNNMLKAADSNRNILENLDKLSSLKLFDKFGKYGELFDAGVGVSKALQKAADVYGETGSWREALVRGAGSYGAGQLVGAGTEADPSLAIWDIATSEIFKGSAAADAVNAGSNAENLFDYFLDLAHTASSDTRTEGIMDTVFGGKAMSYGELADKMMNGDYGDNIKNLVDAENILLAENNSDLYNAVFGEEGMGLGEFLMGFGDTAEDTLIKGNAGAEAALNKYRDLIRGFYAGKGGAQ